MRPSDIVSVIRQALAEKGTTAYRASLDAGLPGNAIRYALEARATKSDRLAEICDALGLEFYVGPPRAQPPAARGSVLSPAALHDLETGARALNRVVADAGGDPVPDDLWPVLAARKGGAAAAAENANLPPGARPVDVVELAATAGGGAEALGEEVAGCVWFRRDWLDCHGLDPAQCMVIRVPASITTSASAGAPRASSIDARVLSSLTAPENTSERRTKPEPSSTSPRVRSGQSPRFSLEWPRRALLWAAASPSKKVLVRS